VKRLGIGMLAAGLAVVMTAAAQGPAPITVDYPETGTVFPPDMSAPTFLWRDASAAARFWTIEIKLGDGASPLRFESRGERLTAGEIDPRSVSSTNELPRLTPLQAAAHTWKPDAATWAAIKARSVEQPATVTIVGRGAGGATGILSRGGVAIETSRDPVGAPIFYRDVPLMPSELEKGIIKPLAAAAVPLIAWRLRDVGESGSRLLMEGLHTCANCHSFSKDGATLGMDLDGPQNDKGMYTLASIQPRMSIRNQDVIEWSSFKGKLTGDLRIGFMSQVSPDGQFVVTMIKGQEPPGAQPQREYANNFYVANFTDYRFLQVFYPTRGILAWYSRATGRLEPVPGADDAGYVQTNAVWTPDGKYLIFARAQARDAYPPGQKLAGSANDSNETRIQYDLYRIPFNQGRGGKAEPIVGASQNGMSNSFPKVSPDGRWIVFVQARNGLLMRPDSKLYVVPVAGGAARPLRSNTPLMNSWHSFSPNGRWLVFSSKSRSPYTQMYLTHLDEEANASPPILIENATAANRAVNLPEFVNIAPNGLLSIATPAVDYYKAFDEAVTLFDKGQFEAATNQWKQVLALNPGDPKAHTGMGNALQGRGNSQEAAGQYREALALDPGFPEAHNNLGIVLDGEGRSEEAIAHFRKAVDGKPGSAQFRNNLGHALAAQGKLVEAIPHYQAALEIKPRFPEAHNNLGVALAGTSKFGEAIPHLRQYLESHPESAAVQNNLAYALSGAGRIAEAIPHFQKVVDLNPGSAEAHNNLGLALAGARRPGEAAVHFEQALQINPAYAEAHANLATVLYGSGRYAQAVEHWRQVLRADPNNVGVLDQTARVLATSPDPALRNGAVAVALAERAVAISAGREAAILDTAAAAYAEAKRFPEAVQAERRALELAIQRKQQLLTKAFQDRVALYEARTPLRGTRSPVPSPVPR
jgi:tetratricopeptide (TPR) repeat protein